MGLGTGIGTGAQMTPPQVSQELAWQGQWGYRLNLSSATTITLVQIGANAVAGLVSNGAVIPSAAQFGVVWDISAQNAMDGNGVTTGALVNASLSTTFAVYWCNAGDFAGGLGFSTTMPSRVSGVYMLGNGTVSSQCFFLGWIRVDGSGNVNNSTSSRGIVNYYNRQSLTLLASPGYTNDSAETTFNFAANASWTQINAGTNDSVAYIANGEDDCAFTMHVVAGAAVSGLGPVFFGIGDNSTTNPDAACSMATAAAKYTSDCIRMVVNPSAGHRTANMLGYNSNNAFTVLADNARHGATADPRATFLIGRIRG